MLRRCHRSARVKPSKLMLGHLGLVFEVEEIEQGGRMRPQYPHARGGPADRPRRPELEDFQYLLNRILNRNEEGAANVIVDVEGYRQKEKQDFLGRIRELADAGPPHRPPSSSRR